MNVNKNQTPIVIGIDHGYGNIKTASSCFRTSVKAYDTEPTFTGNMLVYNGRYYIIGEGHKEFIPEKQNDDDYYILTLAAVCFSRICRLTQTDEEFGMQLTATLPVILSELYTIRKSTTDKEVLPRREGDLVLTEVIDYINQNLTAIGSLSELQQRFFFSKSTLNRMFLESTGSTVWEYVIIKRLHAARRMLIDGKSAAAAASACGFGDYSAFYRQYRRVFGESPCRERKPSKKG